MHACEKQEEKKKAHACERQGEKEKRMHAHNFKIEKIIVSTPSKSKSDCIGVFVSIKTSKQDLTPLYFNDIFLREYFFTYSNLLTMFVKIA